MFHIISIYLLIRFFSEGLKICSSIQFSRGALPYGQSRAPVIPFIRDKTLRQLLAASLPPV